MVRVEAFRQVGGYNAELIAGEDPDLAVRIRQHGWIILRIDAEMTLHDMAMTRFGQWWKRCDRSGFAFAQGAAMHGKPPERHWVRHVHSIDVLGNRGSGLHSVPGLADSRRESGLAIGLPAARGLDRPASPETGDAQHVKRGCSPRLRSSVAFPTPSACFDTGSVGFQVAAKP